MSADFKDTIFDAFTCAESSVTNKIQGTGLRMLLPEIWLKQWEAPLMWRVNWDREAVLRFS